MINDVNLRSKLEAFRKASFELNEAWQTNEQWQEDSLGSKYPFNKSFDELVLEIGDWVDTNLEVR